MKQYTATANDDGVRLSRFVQSVTRDFPTSLLYKSFRNKRVKVNGKKAVPEYRIQAGDLIELYINDEFFPPEGAKTVQKAAPKKKQNQPKVNIIYEDENIAVLYKPTHLLCHSDRTGDANLVDAFTQYLAEKGEYDPHGENRFKPGICNRLDRGTEGLVIAAKSYAALRDMNEIIRTDLLGIPLAHPGNGVLRVVAIDHRHLVAFQVVEVTCRQYGKGGFADPALLGGKGDIKGCFLVFHIAFVHYWLIDLFTAFNQSFVSIR